MLLDVAVGLNWVLDEEISIGFQIRSERGDGTLQFAVSPRDGKNFLELPLRSSGDIAFLSSALESVVSVRQEDFYHMSRRVCAL
jgi:hypothetical protein